jgi:ABC-type antimicrobial peptide transport system permease subunit
MVLHVRASRSSTEIVPPVLAAVQSNERDVPMATVRTLADEVGAELVRERLVATLSGVFQLGALALICIGLYGLMAFTVSRRAAEIGIRMALGASRSSVRWLVARQALAIILAGVAIGCRPPG